MPEHAYPGLEVLARETFERARKGLPPDVGVALLLTFHYGSEWEGGLAWVAGMDRETAISAVCEWLLQQCKEGRTETVHAMLEKWLLKGGRP